MIDLDMAMVDDYRPSTSGSDAMHPTSAVNDNPFNLEDQVQLSQNNKRASYHFQSKSEPNQTVPGLLTPQQQDAGGNQVHARGVSSASQLQSHPNNITNKQQIPNQSISSAPQYSQHHRPSQRSQQMMWDGWSHTHAYGLGSDDQSPPMSVTTDTSLEEDDVDDLWETFDRLALARRNQIAEEDEETENEYPYSYSSDSDFQSQNGNARSFRKSRVSAGPNGRPLLDFPVPRGVDAEVLCNSNVALGGGAGVEVGMEDLLLKASRELRDGTRVGRDLLRAMRLEEVVVEGEEEAEGDETGTVRLIR
jgi:protein-serine/threonine kinase